MQKKIIATVILTTSSLISTAIAVEPTSLPPKDPVLKKHAQRSDPTKSADWGIAISRKAPKKFDPRRMERAEDEDDEDERTILKRRTKVKAKSVKRRLEPAPTR